MAETSGIGRMPQERFQGSRERGFQELLRIEKNRLGDRAQEKDLYVPQPEQRHQKERMPWDSVFSSPSLIWEDFWRR